MRKILSIFAVVAIVTVTALSQDARPQRGQWGPQRQQLTEEQQAIGKFMAEDEGIKKIREKAIKDMVAYLVKKGHKEEDAKAVVEAGAKVAERFRSASGRGNRQRPNREGDQRPPRPERN